MAPNQPSDTTPFVGYDPGNDSRTAYSVAYASTTGPYYIITSSANTFGNWGNNAYDGNWSDQQKFSPRLAYAYAKFLSTAEKAYLRKINFKPTREGVNVCLDWHARSQRWVSSLPQLQARFDRRIPCWRAARWKSLT